MAKHFSCTGKWALTTIALLMGVVFIPAMLQSRNNSEEHQFRTKGYTPQPKGTKDNPSIPKLVLDYEIAHHDTVTALAFSPDAKVIASGTGDGLIRLWDFQSGRELIRLTEAIPKTSGFSVEGFNLSSLAFSPDGAILAGAGIVMRSSIIAGGEVKLWDVAAGKLLRTITVHNTFDRTESVVFAPDGKTLFTASKRFVGKSGQRVAQGEISEWEVVTGVFRRKWKALDEGLDSIAISPDGKTMATAAFGAIKLWELSTGESTQILNKQPAGPTYSLSFSPAGRIMATCSDPRLAAMGGSIEYVVSIHFWDTQTGYLGRVSVGGPGINGNVTAVAFSPDGKHIVSGNNVGYSPDQHVHEATLKVWEIHP